MNGPLSDFWYWLNSNILVSSEGTKALQKYLFLQRFLWDSHLFSVVNKWSQFRQ